MALQSQKTIWLVDDNGELRSVAEGLFLDHGHFTLRTFPSCELALQAAKEETELPEALLLDIELPGMSGLQAIPHFREIIPQTKIIILSNFDKNPYIRQAFAQKIDGYLLKPFDIDDVEAAIDAALHGGARVDARVIEKIAHLIGLSGFASTEYGLTEREVETLRCLEEGLNKPQIANRLNISVNTVKKHLQNAYQKLSVHSETAAIVKLLREHILPKSSDNNSYSE